MTSNCMLPALVQDDIRDWCFEVISSLQTEFLLEYHLALLSMVNEHIEYVAERDE